MKAGVVLASMMQPGSTICPLGWSREYQGYLASSEQGATKSEFICLDRDAEAGAFCNVTNSSQCDNDANENTYAARISPVELKTTTGDIMAPRSHPAQYEQMCAVCSKPRAEITCPPIMPPANGSIICDNGQAYGSACEYTCRPGYLLEGPAVLTCQASGAWTQASCSDTPDIIVHSYVEYI